MSPRYVLRSTGSLKPTLLAVLVVGAAACGGRERTLPVDPVVTPFAPPGSKPSDKDVGDTNVPADVAKMLKGVDPRLKELLSSLPVVRKDYELPDELYGTFVAPGLKSTTQTFFPEVTSPSSGTTPTVTPTPRIENAMSFTLNASGFPTLAMRSGYGSPEKQDFVATYDADGTTLRTYKDFRYNDNAVQSETTEITWGKSPSGFAVRTSVKKTESSGDTREIVLAWTSPTEVTTKRTSTSGGIVSKGEYKSRYASPRILMDVSETLKIDDGDDFLEATNTFGGKPAAWTGRGRRIKNTYTSTGASTPTVIERVETCKHVGNGILECTSESTTGGKLESKSTSRIQLVLEIVKGEKANVEDMLLESKSERFDSNTTPPTSKGESTTLVNYDEDWRVTSFSNSSPYEYTVAGVKKVKTVNDERVNTYDEQGRLVGREEKRDGVKRRTIVFTY